MKKRLFAFFLVLITLSSVYAGKFSLGLKPGYIVKGFNAINENESRTGYIQFSQIAIRGISVELNALYEFVPADTEKLVRFGVVFDGGVNFPLGYSMTFYGTEKGMTKPSSSPVSFDGILGANVGIYPNDLMHINIFVGPEFGYDKLKLSFLGYNLQDKNIFTFGLGFGGAVCFNLAKWIELQVGFKMSQIFTKTNLYSSNPDDYPFYSTKEKYYKNKIFLGTIFHIH